jgi:predicted transcriptional regulator
MYAAVENGSGQDSRWRFVTNHGLAFVVIARDPDIRLRDLAARLGITERAVQKIVGDLVDAGYVKRIHVGRRNRYEVDTAKSFRHPEVNRSEVGLLVELLNAPS